MGGESGAGFKAGYTQDAKKGRILMAENYRAERIALREENLYMQCILHKQEEVRAKEKLEEGWAYGERRGSRI